MSAMSEIHQELGLESGLPLAAYNPEQRVSIIATWLTRVEAQRLDVILAKYKAVSKGLGRAEARRVWTEAFAVYCAFGGV